jgi:CRISPR/Cas system-associated endonuclease Cas1
VFALLNLGKDFAVTPEGLPVEVRQELARKVVNRIQSQVRYHGESMPMSQVMDRQARLLVRHIEGKDKYSSFVMPW